MSGLVLVLCTLSALAMVLSGPSTTHWLVVEEGFIKPRDDPSFELTRPQDLFAFLHQDSLREEIIATHQDLIGRGGSIQELWSALEKATDPSALVEMEDCYGDLDLYPSVVDSIRRDKETEGWISKLQGVVVKDVPPDCSKFSSLPFSMSTFEHLEGMRDRLRLSMVPDVNLPLWVAPAGDMNAFGQQLSRQLRRNGTSWLLYALASVYWKVQGDAPQAVECSRRAVLYAPREYKDIALLSLGDVFHRAMRAAEARTLFQAAVDHAPGHGANHLALGSALAAAGDAAGALVAYEAAERRGEVSARSYVRAARCSGDVARNAGHVETLLHQIQANISEYRAVESHWWRQQATFLNSLKQYDSQFTDEKSSLDAICAGTERVLGLRVCEVKRAGDRHQLAQLFLGRSVFPEAAAGEGLARRVARQLRALHAADTGGRRVLRTLAGTINFHVHLEHKLDMDFSDPTNTISIDHKDRSETFTPSKNPGNFRAQSDASEDGAEGKTQTDLSRYPPTYKVNRHREEFDTEDEWPSREACAAWAPKFAQLDPVYPVFLPFENKGLIVDGVLSARIGLTLQEEHPLPWRPPVCTDPGAPGATASAPALPRLPKNGQSEGVPTEDLRTLLLRYVGDGRPERAQHMHEAEIGQRILTAHKKKVAPKWILYTLSSLYWRVRNNNANALTCLASASQLAPARHRDVVHASLASVLLEVGYVEEALSVATQAFQLSSHEPATNFLLALVHLARNDRAAHTYHLRQALRADSEHAAGRARALLYAAACRDAVADFDDKEASAPEGVCAASASAAAAEAEGEGCARAPLQAFRHHGYKLEEEISTIVRLLNLRPHADEEWEEASHPWERAAAAGEDSEQPRLQQRYRLLEKMLRNCGEEECSNFYPVKAQEVQGHSCFFQHLRFWYWLPYLRLETLLADRGIRLSDKLEPGQRSHNKFPACPAPPARGDPALEWLRRVPSDGWRHVADLVREVGALLGRPGSHEEVSSLLAHHVDRSGSWLSFLAAGLWCGGLARGACCLRCFAAALHAAPPRHRDVPLLSLVAVLHLQDKVKEAKHAAYLALPLAPKSKLHLFVVGISHTYVGEYEAAIRMLRASLTQEPGYAVARACLRATMCLVLLLDEDELSAARRHR